jgi:RiboL-PSP-HEPN
LHAIESRKRQLDDFFERAKERTLSDVVRSDLAKHGAVLVCGFVERSVETIVMDRVNSLANIRVANFVRRHFTRGTNYECEPICQLLERFDLEWSKSLRAYLANNDDVVQSMLSVYGLRNSIAHGGTASAGLSYVLGYYECAKRLVEAMKLATR